MQTHLTKLTAFVALQATLFLLATFVARTPAVTPSARGSLIGVDRVRQALHEDLYPLWLKDPSCLQRGREEGAADGELREIFDAYRLHDDSYPKSIVEKDQLLRTAEGRRLILVGGSNLAFGIDGPLLRERYGLTPVNLGIHEMLRAEYMLRHVSEHLHRGDVIILCLEYGTLMSGGEASDPALRRDVCKFVPALECCFAASPPSPFAAWKQYGDEHALAEFATNAREIAAECARRTVGLPGRVQSHGLAFGDDLDAEFNAELDAVADSLVDEYLRWSRKQNVYARSGFDEFGDFVGHYGLRAEREVKPIGSGGVGESRREGVVKSFAILNRYIADFEARGARVFLAYPPLCEADDIFAREFEAVVEAECDAPVLFPIEAARTKREQHYDTCYHLNWGGICERMTVWTTALDRCLDPVVTSSPAEHVAARDRTMRATVLATAQDASGAR